MLGDNAYCSCRQNAFNFISDEIFVDVQDVDIFSVDYPEVVMRLNLAHSRVILHF